MMNFVLYAIVALIAVELFLRLPIASLTKTLLAISGRAMAIISSPRISDHWKQKAILAYAGRLALTTVKLGGLFLVIILIVYGLCIGFTLVIRTDASPAALLMTPSGLIATSILSAGYFFLRGRFVKKKVNRNDYSFIERFLHYLALGMPGVAEASFDLDCALNKSFHDYSDKRHVFIAGLARAGTTVLMRAFYNTGRFRSLTYRDMPFVLMPNTWKGISSPFWREKAPDERAHGDRVMVNYDSPEALEEVFWRTFCGDDYILDNCLKPHDVDDEIIEKFRRYVSLIISSAGDELKDNYLSKNNNNILRLPSIKKAFPNALILVPFRDPVQQAMSLKRQHERFCVRHSSDRFSFRYMTWLGHHEFGNTHKPFVFDRSMIKNSDRWPTQDIHYWINLWTDTYSYLLDQQTDNILFVSYENLCGRPVEVLSRLFQATNPELSLEGADIDFSANVVSAPEGLDDGIIERAAGIYAALQERMRQAST